MEDREAGMAKEVRYTYDIFTLKRNGYRVHLDRMIVEGTEPERQILLVHGVTYSSHEFDINFKEYSFVRRLAREGYAVWRIDITGFGRSDRVEDGFLPDSQYAADDIAAAVELILEVSGRERMDVLGWSWGTVTTSLFAAQHPDLLDRLVLYAPILVGVGPEEVTEPFHHNDWEHAASDFQRTPDGELDLSLAEQEVIDWWCDGCLTIDGEYSPNGGRRDIFKDPSVRLIDLSAITVPTLVICGTRDPFMVYEEVAKVLEDLPEGSELEVIEGASHAAIIEIPYYRFFQDRVLAFLAKE